MWGKRFPQPGGSLIHTDLKPYVCTLSGKTFVHLSVLKCHIETCPSEESFVCKVCSSMFSHYSCLKWNSQTHTGERHHVCPVCNKCFALSGIPRKQMQGCTEEKPHKCELFSTCFSNFGNMNGHLHLHTGEKQSECTVCQRSSFIMLNSRDLSPNIQARSLSCAKFVTRHFLSLIILRDVLQSMLMELHIALFMWFHHKA